MFITLFNLYEYKLNYFNKQVKKTNKHLIYETKGLV